MSQLASVNLHAGQRPLANFGTILGVAPGGVPVYSSDYNSVDKTSLPNRHTYRNYINGIYMGYKWQCVEFARRWMYSNKGYIFDDVSIACDIFWLRFVHVIKDNNILPLHSFRNGSKHLPKPGCLLIWDKGGEFNNTGHVAVVTEVSHNYIRFVEQNVNNCLWPSGRDYSSELKSEVNEMCEYWIEPFYHGAKLIGWVIQTDDDTDSEKHPRPTQELFNLQIRGVEKQPDTPWLDLTSPDEASYAAVYGHTLTKNESFKYRYFCISETALKELKRATNELHAMFMHATDYVLQNDSILQRFNIPRSLWSLLHQSWDNRANQMITGRMDFSLSKNGLKLYEYNADSAACYLECGKIQGKWANHFRCNTGKCSGETLFDRLVDAWSESGVSGKLHIMLDNDPDEYYHSLFMKSAVEAAGIQCKVIKGMSGISWDDNGFVVDADGERIRWVWKTWAWDTALNQIRDDCNDLESSKKLTPQLARVILRKDVIVFEPFWTIIPSNKAILPVLSELFPEHSSLLYSGFTVNEHLKEIGYVSKPVAGRCGLNVSIFGHNGSVVKVTNGKFKNQEHIFQEFFGLPKIQGVNVQISAMTVSGIYAASCVRVDPSIIISSDSDVIPLRIIDDNNFLEFR